MACMKDVSALLKKFDLGESRIGADDLGVSPLNRLISARHVHGLGRRILEVEGFSRSR